MAAPLLLGALRRLADSVNQYDIPQMPVMRHRKPTQRRLAMIGSWHRTHPAGPRPYLHRLDHAAVVLAGVGVDAATFVLVAALLKVGRDDSDEMLMRACGIAAGGVVPHSTVVEICEVAAFVNATHAPREVWRWVRPHLFEAREAGFSWEEIADVLRTGGEVDAAQVTMMATLRDMRDDWEVPLL